MRSHRRLLASLALAAQLPGAETAAVAILKKNCVSCHGEKPSANLDLRTRETTLRGGARGPAVVPGDVLESLLYRTITHEADIKMPFNQPKLSDADIKTVRDWIEDGAKWDDDGGAAK